MTKLANLASRIPFAHLLGVKAAVEEPSAVATAAAAAAAAEDDDEEKKKEEEAKAKAKAEEDKQRDGESDEDYEKRTGKKAKSKQAEGEDDEEKMQQAAAAATARCATIVAHGIKTGAVRQACAYAFDTSMSAEVAIATLDATADDRKAEGGSLGARMGAEPVPIAKPEAGKVDANDPKAIALTVIASAKKARGEA